MKEHYIDLHLHLDGAITVEIARQLAQIQNISLPKDDAELERLLTVPPDCQDLNEFLECFDQPLRLMQTRSGLREAVRLVGQNIRSQGVIYAEIRFAPQQHTSQGMTQEDAVQAALEGLQDLAKAGRAEADCPDSGHGEGAPAGIGSEHAGLKANLILCCMRGEGNDELNEETLRLAKEYLVEDGGVVAMDLAGAEGLYPTERYRELFGKAREHGIPFTIHAGEADGADSVRAAVEFGAQRIGHGVRMREDPAVVELVRAHGIFLEMCPTSNRQTRAVEDMSLYPLTDYLEDGIRVTLNTDDMGIEGTTMAEEFRYMEREHHLTGAQKRMLLMNAVEGAFTSEEVKEQLRKQLELR